MARTTATILPFPTAEGGNTSNFKETKRGQGDGDGGGGGKTPRGGGGGRPKAAKLNLTVLQMDNKLREKGYGDIVAFDRFSQKAMLQKAVPRPDYTAKKPFEKRPLADHDITAFAEVMEVWGFERQPMDIIKATIEMVAEDNAFSEPEDLIRSWAWDGDKRIDDFFFTFCGTVIEGETDREKRDHERYVRAVSRCLFIALVARVLRPGCKCDTMVVLESGQGAFKSSLLRKLAIKDAWFSDNLPQELSSKEAREHLPGNLIIEMQELGQIRKSRVESVKAFLSAQNDKYRPVYARYTINWPRQNVFVGTTNDEFYLKDVTGNRRFWPITVGTIKLDDVTDYVVQQLYAEAKVALDAGEDWWLTPALEEIAKGETRRRMVRNPWTDKALDIIRDKRKAIENAGKTVEVVCVTTEELLAKLGFELSTVTKLKQMDAGDLLKFLGGERRKTTDPNDPESERKWRFHFAKGLTVEDDPPEEPAKGQGTESHVEEPES